MASPGTEGYRDFLGRPRGLRDGLRRPVVPTQVQGREAPRPRWPRPSGGCRPADCDVIVVVRGGGSKADLATFDAEPVARAIATSDIPVWTGIGHTGDQSVADEVANRSFITPTECGQELARLATEFWRPVDGGRAESPARLAARPAGRQPSGRSIGAASGMATGARSQLDRHADGLVHRARTLRGVGAGPARRPRPAGWSPRCEAAGPGRPPDARSDGDRDAGGRTRRLAALPGRRLEAEDLRPASGAACSAPTTTSASSSGATR